MLSCTWLLRDMTHAPKWTSVTLHILNDWTFTHTNISLIHWERVALAQLSLKKGPPLIHMEWCVWGGWLSDSEVELQECWPRIYVLGLLSDLSRHHTKHLATLQHNGYSGTTTNTPLCSSERGCTISLPSWAWKPGSWLGNSGWK